ncbi:hypothetical protein SARC_08513 [Sphaeroforma arctica JP610]|uniref:OCEL domain-containing protein n=1 Tax=Sphaeroforma arctica JP610 TaxID=667725 RepID=A0A0L0FRC6_9EUKA|nr:hypothetical protein SARC_08513 [Sphaeroforma arctica JP610]KNC79081.1 hypothetical protein SARC_08513 [Sphaeroforma arctica JP610]|eukprot:XP_014152983.1 hypothetical protein SARC_08513 [Sphaeroforma arctica JP610]
MPEEANDSGDYSLLYPKKKKIFAFKINDDMYQALMANSERGRMTLTLPEAGKRLQKGALTLSAEGIEDSVWNFTEKPIPDNKRLGDTVVHRQGTDYFQSIGSTSSRLEFPITLSKSLAQRTRDWTMGAQKNKDDKVTQIIKRDAPKEKHGYGKFSSQTIGITTKPQAVSRGTMSGRVNLTAKTTTTGRLSVSPAPEQSKPAHKTAEEAKNFRERVVHLLALRPTNRQVLESRLHIKTDDPNLTALLSEIAITQGIGENEYKLRDEIYKEVQPGYTRFSQSDKTNVMEKAKAALRRTGMSDAAIEKTLNPPPPVSAEGSDDSDARPGKRKSDALSPPNSAPIVPAAKASSAKKASNFLNKRQRTDVRLKSKTPVKGATLKSPNPAAGKSPAKSPLMPQSNASGTGNNNTGVSVKLNIPSVSATSGTTTSTSNNHLSSLANPAATKRTPISSPTKPQVPPPLKSLPTPFASKKSPKVTSPGIGPGPTKVYSSTSFNKQSRVAYSEVSAGPKPNANGSGLGGGAGKPPLLGARPGSSTNLQTDSMSTGNTHANGGTGISPTVRKQHTNLSPRQINGRDVNRDRSNRLMSSSNLSVTLNTNIGPGTQSTRSPTANNRTNTNGLKSSASNRPVTHSNSGINRRQDTHRDKISSSNNSNRDTNQNGYNKDKLDRAKTGNGVDVVSNAASLQDSNRRSINLEERYTKIKSREQYKEYYSKFDRKHKQYGDLIDWKKRIEGDFKVLYDKKVEYKSKYGENSDEIKAVEAAIQQKYQANRKDLVENGAKHDSLAMELKHIKMRLKNFLAT